MFEGILEKILQSRLGQYIDGLDRKNLSMGVWSGKILIENATLKVKAFEKFKLPFRIKFGKIARLKATVPWMSLSSSPVEIMLDSLMVILVSKPKHEWEIIDQIGKNFKRELLSDFAEALLESLRKGESEEDASQNKGYLERLSMKVLDNIQIKIRNIHVRYEVNFDSSQHSLTGFSLGVRLEQLNIVTTNEEWKIHFLDRTQEENQDKSMHKLLELTNLSIYSDSSESCFFSKLYSTDEELISAFRDQELQQKNN